MQTRWFLTNFLTGRNILDLPVLDGTWETRRNTPESLSVTIDLNDPEIRALGIRNAAAPGITALHCTVGDHFMGSGIIWPHRYNKSSGLVEITASGIGSYFAHRTIQTLAALTQPLIDSETGEPTPETVTTLTGLSLGTIMKRVLEQSMLFPGGDLPIVFQDDEAGIHERTYNGSDFKEILTVLGQLADVENGPDWEFVPRFTEDGLGVEYLFRTGTNANPRLTSPTVHDWDYTAPEGVIDDLVVTVDASNMGSLGWATGGRQAGEAIVDMQYNAALTDAGYPLFELVDTTRTTVSNPVTLAAHNAETLRNGRGPTEFWPFKVSANASPFPGEYRVGDMCRVHVRDDPYIPDGVYVREIASLSGDAKGDWVTVTTAEVLGG